jgi:hypothetical protein
MRLIVFSLSTSFILFIVITNCIVLKPIFSQEHKPRLIKIVFWGDVMPCSLIPSSGYKNSFHFEDGGSTFL